MGIVKSVQVSWREVRGLAFENKQNTERMMPSKSKLLGGAIVKSCVDLKARDEGSWQACKSALCR